MVSDSNEPKKISESKEPEKVSGAYWLLPIFLVFIGGIIAWALVRKRNGSKARLLLIVGIALTFVMPFVFLVVGAMVGGYITGFSEGLTDTQSVSNTTYFSGATPFLSFTVTNTGPDVNITSITTRGPGISGVYTWTPDAAWQFANQARNGVSSFTITDTTSPTYAPVGSTGGTPENPMTVVISFANGRAASISLP